MKSKIEQEWAALVREGAQGQATRFKLRATRLAQMIRKDEPGVADALLAGLGGGDLTRLAPANVDVPELLTVDEVPALKIEPFWPDDVRRALLQVAAEWRSRALLEAGGLHPASTVLLHGPPGVGKTLAASWLARETGLPLASLHLAATIDSYLGKTGQNIAKVLDFARAQACVLFLDEFDAIAKRRDDNQDVGELKRVVNVLLQAVDQWSGPSMIVAATNHVDLLDRAMLRRFEISVEFPPATIPQLRQILLSVGVPGDLAKLLAERLKGEPISDAIRLVKGAKKVSLMERVPLRNALLSAVAATKDALGSLQMRRAKVLAMHKENRSAHQIARELGISHTTVLRDIRASKEDEGWQRREEIF